MPDQSKQTDLLPRDGTSQSDRRLHALDPEHVSVDERSAEDLLAFAKEYAKELKFYDEHNREAGTWDRFFAPDGEKADLAEIAAFMENPLRFTGRKARQYGRPHFALFLTFLKLLRHTRDQLDTLARRHLEYYYEQVLRMTRKGPVPDQVHVLLRLVPNVAQARLPAGTRLNAGKDSAGKARTYATDREILVNRAQIERVSAVRLDLSITGVREARERALLQGTAEDAFMEMLKIALGKPSTGDDIPDFPKKEDVARYPVNLPFLENVEKVLEFTRSGLHMKPFELSSLMRCKRRRVPSADDEPEKIPDEWNDINGILEKAAQTRLGDSSFVLKLEDPKNFEVNFALAIGLEGETEELLLKGLEELFDGLEGVENIDDLYEQVFRKHVKDFFLEELPFFDSDDFVRMMQIKQPIDSDWREINRILQRAGQDWRDDRFFRLEPSNPADFNANFKRALPELTWPVACGRTPADIDEYYELIDDLKEHFSMSAEDLSFVAAAASASDQESEEPEPQDWEQVYRILDNAYRDRVYSGRRKVYDTLRNDRQTTGCFNELVRFALGVDAEGRESEKLLDDLRRYIPRDADHHLLVENLEQLTEKDLNEGDWKGVYRILELAQRNRERLPEPVAQKIEWRNLYAQPDATTAVVTEDPGSGDTPRWKTFGQVPPEASNEEPPAESLGWAISSPLLLLSEGKRTIELTLGFDKETFDSEKIGAVRKLNPLKVEVSGEKGWKEIRIQPEDIQVAASDENLSYGSSSCKAGEDAKPLACIHISFAIGAEADPIAPLAEEGFAHPWPALRLMLRQISGKDNSQYTTCYEPFKDLRLAAVHMRVQVGGSDAFTEKTEDGSEPVPIQIQGLTSFHARNDEFLVDPSKPFEPFGPRPAVGSRFHVAHPELAVKKLDELVFDIEWMGVPDDIDDYYKAFGIAGEKFQTNVVLVTGRRELLLTKPAPVPLFSFLTSGTPNESDQKKTTLPHRLIRPPDVLWPSKKGNNTNDYDRSLDLPEDPDPLAWDRRLLWELTPIDFQHQAYPRLAAEKAIEMAAAIARKDTDSLAQDKLVTYQVNPPYTPKIKRLSVGYSASLELCLDAEYCKLGRSDDQTDRIFHVHPFGFEEIRHDDQGAGVPLLPRYDKEGEFYIGLRGLRPPQNLSLLFQMAEGSADPDLEPVPVEWSCLSGDEWSSLHDGRILSDTTRGLINTGIMEFALKPVEPSRRLPGDLYWLRAAVPRHANAVCDIVAIHTQAVSATLEDEGIAPDHFLQPLPPNSISRFFRPVPGIAAVEQPYTSYGGRGEEQADLFYTRVSERLRHKNRAHTPWDYERLVLERFPQVYKAKCLPAALTENGGEPGKVEIIVIPDVRNQVPFDPLEPKASADLLADIQGYLSDKCPAYVRVEVRNARFVPVQVRVGVRFRSGYDQGFYRRQLERDLIRFLSPWAYEEGADIAIGETIHANSILGFLDGLEYVDYLAAIELFSSEDGDDFKSRGSSVTTRLPDEVLVASRQQHVDLISEGGYEDELFTGIGYMKIELDFIVAGDRSV